jgi:hypothetical protein
MWRQLHIDGPDDPKITKKTIGFEGVLLSTGSMQELGAQGENGPFSSSRRRDGF